MPTKKTSPTAIAPTHLARHIYLIRGQRVMLDADLAAIYDVPTKRLNQATQRNIERFPEDFMFRLTFQEVRNLRSQIVTSSDDNSESEIDPLKYGGRRYLPYVFTEHGVAMLSSVLRSERAVRMNIAIIRAFVKLRELLASNKDLAARMEKLEGGQKRQGMVIEWLAEEIEAIKAPPKPTKRRIGYIS